MCGFMRTQNALLFDIMDSGSDRERTYRKMDGESTLGSKFNTEAKYRLVPVAMFHLFVNNVHCRRVFFGGCHSSVYASTLESYTRDPVVAPRITLLRSGNDDEYINSLPFDRMELHQVFRPISFSAPDTWASKDSRLSLKASDENWAKLDPSSGPEPGSPETKPVDLDAIHEWQEEANKHPGPSPCRRQKSNSPKKHGECRAPFEPVLLNIDGLRVDPPRCQEDNDTRKSMLRKMEKVRFCTYFHLLDSCKSRAPGKTCRFRHEPRLDAQELTVLRNHARKLPCAMGSKCRNRFCIYGHVCPNQPGCVHGARCSLARFHHIEKTAVKVWRKSNSSGSG